MTQAELLRQVFQLFYESGIYKNDSLATHLKRLLYAHSKGWLYASVENDVVILAAMLYRIKEFNDKVFEVMPIKEEGTILFIPILVSKATDKFLANKLLKRYLKDKQIDEIVFQDIDDRIRHFYRFKKE